VFRVTNGTGSGTTNELPGGTYDVFVHYAGDGTFAPSDSSNLQVTVAPEASTTTLKGFDQNNNPITTANNTFPFGSLIFVRADVAPGTSGVGVPTGSVSFTDSFGPIPALNPQLIPAVQVPNPSPLNSRGNTSIGDGIISFDAGTHSITASYIGDSSFNASQTAQGNAVSFTIQPGFAGVSGPTDVFVSAGTSGTTSIGIIASSNFSTAITFTCSGLPAEATCSTTSATGQGPTTVVNTKINITTTAAHTAMLQPAEWPGNYSAALLAGGLPLAGLFVIGGSRRRRWGTFFGITMLMAFFIFIPACGGGGSSSSHHQQDPGTPTGSYIVTVTATARSLTQQGNFTLVVQ